MKNITSSTFESHALKLLKDETGAPTGGGFFYLTALRMLNKANWWQLVQLSSALMQAGRRGESLELLSEIYKNTKDAINAYCYVAWTSRSCLDIYDALEISIKDLNLSRYDEKGFSLLYQLYLLLLNKVSLEDRPKIMEKFPAEMKLLYIHENYPEFSREVLDLFKDHRTVQEIISVYRPRSIFELIYLIETHFDGKLSVEEKQIIERLLIDKAKRSSDYKSGLEHLNALLEKYKSESWFFGLLSLTYRNCPFGFWSPPINAHQENQFVKDFGQRLKRSLEALDSYTLSEASMQVPTGKLIQLALKVSRGIEGRSCNELGDYMALVRSIIIKAGLKDRPIKYLEIGSLFGGSSAFVAAVSSLLELEVNITCIDPADSYYGDFVDPYSGLAVSSTILRNNISRFLGRGSKLFLIASLSTSASAWDSIQDSSQDIVLIDGDHSMRGALFDALFASRKLRELGVMIFDDYTKDIHSGVVDTVEVVKSLSAELTCELYGSSVVLYGVENA